MSSTPTLETVLSNRVRSHGPAVALVDLAEILAATHQLPSLQTAVECAKQLLSLPLQVWDTAAQPQYRVYQMEETYGRLLEALAQVAHKTATSGSGGDDDSKTERMVVDVLRRFGSVHGLSNRYFEVASSTGLTTEGSLRDKPAGFQVSVLAARLAPSVADLSATCFTQPLPTDRHALELFNRDKWELGSMGIAKLKEAGRQVFKRMDQSDTSPLGELMTWVGERFHQPNKKMPDPQKLIELVDLETQKRLFQLEPFVRVSSTRPETRELNQRLRTPRPAVTPLPPASSDKPQNKTSLENPLDSMNWRAPLKTAPPKAEPLKPITQKLVDIRDSALLFDRKTDDGFRVTAAAAAAGPMSRGKSTLASEESKKKPIQQKEQPPAPLPPSHFDVRLREYFAPTGLYKTIEPLVTAKLATEMVSFTPESNAELQKRLDRIAMEVTEASEGFAQELNGGQKAEGKHLYGHVLQVHAILASMSKQMHDNGAEDSVASGKRLSTSNRVRGRGSSRWFAISNQRDYWKQLSRPGSRQTGQTPDPNRFADAIHRLYHQISAYLHVCNYVTVQQMVDHGYLELMTVIMMIKVSPVDFNTPATRQARCDPDTKLEVDSNTRQRLRVATEQCVAEEMVTQSLLDFMVRHPSLQGSLGKAVVEPVMEGYVAAYHYQCGHAVRYADKTERKRIQQLFTFPRGTLAGLPFVSSDDEKSIVSKLLHQSRTLSVQSRLDDLTTVVSHSVAMDAIQHQFYASLNAHYHSAIVYDALRVSTRSLGLAQNQNWATQKETKQMIQSAAEAATQVAEEVLDAIRTHRRENKNTEGGFDWMKDQRKEIVRMRFHNVLLDGDRKEICTKRRSTIYNLCIGLLEHMIRYLVEVYQRDGLASERPVQMPNLADSTLLEQCVTSFKDCMSRLKETTPVNERGLTEPTSTIALPAFPLSSDEKSEAQLMMLHDTIRDGDYHRALQTLLKWYPRLSSSSLTASLILAAQGQSLIFTGSLYKTTISALRDRRVLRPVYLSARPRLENTE